MVGYKNKKKKNLIDAYYSTENRDHFIELQGVLKSLDIKFKVVVAADLQENSSKPYHVMLQDLCKKKIQAFHKSWKHDRIRILQ